jgi:hypothetical protein
MALPPVRLQVWPTAPGAIQPGRNDARAAAQKAFFEAALSGQAGKTAAQAEAQPDRPTASASQGARSAAAAEARATDRVPPPGSIINILV